MKIDEMILFLEHNIHPSSRVVYLGPKVGQPEDDDTSYVMVETAIKNIHLLNTISDEMITVIMNNSGGNVAQGNGIIDAIEQSVSPVRVICYGYCASMAVSILQAATERVLAPNCTVMIHKSTADLETGRKKSEQNWKKYNKRVDQADTAKLLKRIQEVNPEMTMVKLKNKLKHDTLFTSQEAVDFGIADKVLDANKKV